jgi:hypothetical protein
MNVTRSAFVCLFGIFLIAAAHGTEPANLYDLAPDLTVPEMEEATPAPGLRTRAVTSGWERTMVYHALYLPRDWEAGQSYPVVVEYPGNGGFQNDLGDASDGSVEGAVLGYGLSGGVGYVWVCLPCIESASDGVLQNDWKWWGDVEATKRYTIETVTEVCKLYGGDEAQVILCGFSRGAIATHYIGLHDDKISKLWQGFFCHSHFDGVRAWPYPQSDSTSAKERLQRVNGRAIWISHELSTAATQDYLSRSGVSVNTTFVPIPFPNHSAGWLLRDLPERAQARGWLAKLRRPG